MTFNMHAVKHFHIFIELFGAAWAWSAFPFESYNNVIKKLFHGTQCIADQICKSYLRLRFLKNNSSVFDKNNCDEKAKQTFLKIMNECEIKSCINYDENLKMFEATRSNMQDIENIVLEIYAGEKIKSVKVYQRFIFNRVLFHVENYAKMYKRNNSIILIKDKRIFSIQKLVIVVSDSNKEFSVVLGHEYEILNENLYKVKSFSSKDFCYVCQKMTNIKCIELENIDRKCILMNDTILEDKVYVFPLVNRQETD